ncbi:hypothetical protein L218DRAFT_252117 [Marasmius fiardii PR-910]|nr:hypothetical protein L218DRAFT_252117 [Marasmius fiardii PR-910]
MINSPDLPQEIITYVAVDCLHDSATRSDLSNISLISRAWSGPAQSLLHSHVYIATERKIRWLIRKYTQYPHLLHLATSIHLYGWEIHSFSEGSLSFEPTIMAKEFEQLMYLFKGESRGIRQLYIDSYTWDEHHSRRILDSFPAVERLILNRIDFSTVPEHLLALATGMASLKALSVYSISWTDTPNLEERTVFFSQCAKQLSHLDLSPVNLTPSPLNLLSGPALDWSGLRSLRLGWIANNEADSYTAIKGFLSLVGPQVKELTIGTQSSDSDERAMSMDSPCLSKSARTVIIDGR